MEIDLNADLGEGFGPYRMGEDEAMLDIVSSANVACGYHAGDPVIMDKTVRMALARRIEIGAHVGFPDLMGFGRRQIQADPLELANYVVYQIGALAGIAKTAGHRVTHMSFHGALGNMAAASYKLAEPLVRVKQLLEEGTVTSIAGNKLKVAVQSILLHGDTPGAVDLARTVRGVIESAGGTVVPVSQLVR